MAHFYGIIDSHGRSKTDATRQGSKDRGMSGHISGWDLGCKVIVGHNSNIKKDWCDIYATGGSNGGDSQPLATLKESDKYNGKYELLLNWRLPKLLSENEFIEMKESIAALIFDHDYSIEDNSSKEPPHEETCHVIAETIMDQLGFYLKKETE